MEDSESVDHGRNEIPFQNSDVVNENNADETFKVPSSITAKVVKRRAEESSSQKKCDTDSRKENADGNSSSEKIHCKETKKCGADLASSEYVEPLWGSTPHPSHPQYRLTEIKGGVPVNEITLTKSFYTFGRSEKNDTVMLNPSVSRYHAVLQYGLGVDKTEYAWYLYDLNSTHGTFINKRHKVSGRTYVKIEDGYMFKLGTSVRFFVLDLIKSKQISCEESQTSSESDNSDDDDDEGEDLYKRNLVNSLKQWFQNEGQKPVFNVEEFEHSIKNQIFVCKIKLPLKETYGDDSEDFEGIGKGPTKNDAVYEAVGCCWEHLETLGITPAGTKRTRDWKENDYYDSDEDPFFDRTGDLEKKRQKRMKDDKVSSKQKTNPYTEKHHSLLAERGNLLQFIQYLKNELDKKTDNSDNDETEENKELGDIVEYKKTCRADLVKKKGELSKINREIDMYECLMKKAVNASSEK